MNAECVGFRFMLSTWMQRHLLLMLSSRITCTVGLKISFKWTEFLVNVFRGVTNSLLGRIFGILLACIYCSAQHNFWLSLFNRLAALGDVGYS